MATAEQAEVALKALGGTTECAEAGGRLGLLVVQPTPAVEAQDGSCVTADNSCTSPSGPAKDSRTVRGQHVLCVIADLSSCRRFALMLYQHRTAL